MYNEKPNYAEMNKQKLKPMRIEPDRKWFGNIRTVDQKTMAEFNAETMLREKDPYAFLLKKRKVDYGFLLKEGKKKVKNQIESFSNTFGPKQLRIRPKVGANSILELAAKAEKAKSSYKREKDLKLYPDKNERNWKPVGNIKMKAGQSKRIWEELYKVIDSSDVLVVVLDARDPMGTRCERAEEHIEKNSPHKHIIYVLNKVDLVPTSVTAQWVKFFSKRHPTVAYKADLSKPFGRQSLMSLLRQFENFHKEKKTISVGFIGYPNVGKSSVINSLKKAKACKAAPIPGQTKVWQYVALTKRVYLIDCPGVVYESENDSQIDVVLKGVIRAERIKDPDFYISAILERISKSVIKSVYGVESFIDADDFLSKLAVKKGKMKRKAEPDVETVARMVIYDWQFGRLPRHEVPPMYEQNYFSKKGRGKASDEKKEDNVESQDNNDSDNKKEEK